MGAFALANRDKIHKSEQAIFTTTLFICYITVWVLGSGTNSMLKILNIKTGVDPDEDLKSGNFSNNSLFRLWNRVDHFLRPILLKNNSHNSNILQESHLGSTVGHTRLEEDYHPDEIF